MKCSRATHGTTGTNAPPTPPEVPTMPERITSPHNQRLKDAIKLRDRRARDRQGRILIDGARELERALRANVKVLEVFLRESGLSELEKTVVDQAATQGAQLLELPPPLLERVAYGEREGGLVAVAEPPRWTCDQLNLTANSVVAVIEGLEKPGNVGAIARSADAAGVAAILVADGGTDLYNPNAIRASAGVLFSLPVVSLSSSDTLAWLRQNQFRILATRVDGATRYWDADWSGRVAVVLGSESHGLSAVWRGGDVQAVTVPQQGVADSLNVSVTAALLFYESLRRRS